MTLILNLFTTIQSSLQQITSGDVKTYQDLVNIGIGFLVLCFIAWFLTKHVWPFFTNQMTMMQDTVTELQKSLLAVTVSQAETNVKIVELISRNTSQLTRIETKLDTVENQLLVNQGK